MVWLGDGRGRRTFLNRRWLEFTGRAARDQAGRGWQKSVPPDDRRRYLRALRSAADAGTALQTSYRVKRADGQLCLVVEEARPRFDRGRRLAGFVGVCLEAERPDRTDAPEVDASQLRQLSQRIEAVREEERARVARALHDELGQLLTSTKLDLMWLCERLRHAEARPSLPLVNKLQSLAGLVEIAIATVQRITTDLKPPVLDHLGLEAALEWEATKFQARTGIRCRISSRLGSRELDAARATAVFRIAQESLTNVARHAHAGAVRLSLRHVKGNVVLEVQDNGRGITEAERNDRRSVGLLGMRERAHLLGGEVRITGVPGRGTRVFVSIPAQASDD